MTTRWIALATVTLLVAAGGCRPKTPKSPDVSPAPERSTAADALIEHAPTPEQRTELTRERERLDDEARRTLADKDREIARLAAENEALRRRLQ